MPETPREDRPESVGLLDLPALNAAVVMICCAVVIAVAAHAYCWLASL